MMTFLLCGAASLVVVLLIPAEGAHKLIDVKILVNTKLAAPEATPFPADKHLQASAEKSQNTAVGTRARAQHT